LARQGSPFLAGSGPSVLLIATPVGALIGRPPARRPLAVHCGARVPSKVVGFTKTSDGSARDRSTGRVGRGRVPSPRPPSDPDPAARSSKARPTARARQRRRRGSSLSPPASAPYLRDGEHPDRPPRPRARASRCAGNRGVGSVGLLRLHPEQGISPGRVPSQPEELSFPGAQVPSPARTGTAPQAAPAGTFPLPDSTNAVPVNLGFLMSEEFPRWPAPLDGFHAVLLEAVARGGSTARRLKRCRLVARLFVSRRSSRRQSLGRPRGICAGTYLVPSSSAPRSSIARQHGWVGDSPNQPSNRHLSSGVRLISNHDGPIWPLWVLRREPGGKDFFSHFSQARARLLRHGGMGAKGLRADDLLLDRLRDTSFAQGVCILQGIGSSRRAAATAGSPFRKPVPQTSDVSRRARAEGR